VHREKNATADEKAVMALAESTPEGDYEIANFQLVSALVQMPHVDPLREIERRAGRALTETERRHLDRRIHAARVWVERYASEEEKTRLQETLPARAAELSAAQRAFLQALAAALPSARWEDDALQALIFEVARLTPIEQPLAFKAIYRVLLDREAGPKAGNLLAFLDPKFVIPRFQELQVTRADFWRDTAISADEFGKWIAQNREKIASATYATAAEMDLVSFETTFVMKDGKRNLKRVLLHSDDARHELIAHLQPVLASLPA
jgi:lysyl-tRNA synthetase class 1